MLHRMRKEEMRKIFNEVKKEIEGKDENGKERDRRSMKRDEEKMGNSNLTKEEQDGLKSLRKRVKDGEIMITETDKSKRFSVLTREQYIDSGKKHTEKDILVNKEQIHKVQKYVNDHCDWMREIFMCGTNWNHCERVAGSMDDNSEAVAPLYLLIKDHKGWKEEDKIPPPSRPVCSGNNGINKHLSELVSYVLEPLAHTLDGAEIDSTGGMLEKVEKLNKRLQKGEVENIPDMKEEINIHKRMNEKEIFNKKLKERRVECLRKLTKT